MKTIDIISRAAKNLRQAKVRTILTSLGISVGAFTITIALAAGAAGRELTNTLVETSGDDAALTVYKEVNYDEQQSQGPVNLDAEAVEYDDSLSEADKKAIESVDGVEQVVPIYYVSADHMTRPGQDRYATPLTIKIDRTKLRLAAGSLDDNMLQPGKVAIPDTYLEALGFKDAEAAIGQSVTVHVSDEAGAKQKDLEYTIGAVYTNTQETIYFQETMYLSISDGESLYRYQAGEADSYLSFRARVAAGEDVAKVQQAIEDRGDYMVYSMRDERETLMTMVNVMQWGLVGVGAIAILASIFGIVNTQYISVLERTRQIGLMKALGASRRDIAKLFRYEAAWVGFLGGIIGTVLALIASLANPVVVDMLELDEGTRLLIFEPLTSAILIGGLMLIAVTAGYFPSRKAARLDPVEALKYE